MPNKLIDSALFIARLKDRDWLGFSFDVAESVIDALPDASGPLQVELERKDARIKALESETRELRLKLSELLGAVVV